MAKLTVAEARKILKDDVGFSDEQIAAATDAQVQKFAEGYMRQADYDRTMNEEKGKLQKAQADLDAANARLNTEMAEWATAQANGEGITKKMRADLEAAQVRVTQLTQRVTQIATDTGLDPAKALEGIEQTPPPKPEGPDLSGYAKTADINTQIGSLAQMALTLPAELYALATEHQTLFGKPLDTREIVKELQTRASTPRNQKSLNPREIWEEQFKVADRRTEVAKKAHDEEISAAEQRGREAALSESVIPGQINAPGQHAPIFGERGRTSVLQRPQPGTTTQNAAQAFRTGKYRQAKTGAGKPAA